MLRRITTNSTPAELLFTSPPYLGVTNYFYDQWLRLWMLGGPPAPKKTGETNKGKFESLRAYRKMLSTVFGICSEIMSQSGTAYIRTDARPLTLSVTKDVLRQAFPDWNMRVYKRPFNRPTQTALFGDKSTKPGEVDILLRGPVARKRTLSVRK
jgi:hypothetical protein